jgi:hypothetical protein
VKRSKLLPHGGDLDESVATALAVGFKKAVEFARQVGRVKMTDEAGEAWTAAYPELSAERPGLVGCYRSGGGPGNQALAYLRAARQYGQDRV